MNEKIYQAAADAIANADAMVITAGAGMGVDSGLPDFRGDHGFWKAYPPYASKGLSFVDMANPQWFESQPAFAWGFYGHRLTMYRETTPHAGFTILKKWADEMPKGYFVFTSNVDGHFQTAGFDETRIEEVHGSIHFCQCLHHCGADIFPTPPERIEIDESTMLAVPPLPACPNCHGLARPNILMFGDWDYTGTRQIEQSIRFRNWLDRLENARLVLVECGAGRGVPTVRMASERIVAHLNGVLIRINVREPGVPSGQLSLPVSALEALTAIDALRG